MIDHEETLRFVMGINNDYISTSQATQVVANQQSMELLLARDHIWKRWLANYNTRTKIRIDLFFNLASQKDNRINIEIANTSKQIAADTQRVAEEARKDSSSMITIAAVTMLFLPGTFVSVCLSFLKVQQSANVKRRLFSAWLSSTLEPAQLVRLS